MTVLNGALLGFAAWTLAVLLFPIGLYRWARILSGSAGIHEFPADKPTGAPWYQRAMRAHANCVENLPVFGAIVYVASSVGLQGMPIDALAVTVVAARVGQSVTHVSFVQTARAVTVRFSFFLVQIACMLAMIALIVLHARR